MTKSLHATFDGLVLRPDEPVELALNTRVRITIETIDAPEEKLYPPCKLLARSTYRAPLTGPPT